MASTTNLPSLLGLVRECLVQNGLPKTARQLQKESRKKKIVLDNGKGGAQKTVGLESIFNEYLESQKKPVTNGASTDKKRRRESSSSESSSSSSSSDDSSSSSEEEEKPRPVKKAKTQVNGLAKKATATPVQDSSSEASSVSDRDSSSSDSEDGTAPVAKQKPQVVEQKTQESSDDSSSSSSSSSDSSDDEPQTTTKAKAAPPPAPSTTKKAKKQSEPPVKKAKKTKDPAPTSAPSTNGTAANPETPKESEQDTLIVPSTSQPGSSSESAEHMHPDRLRKLPALGQGNSAPKTEAIPATEENIKRLKRENVPFSRIPAGQEIDPRLASNAYVPYDYAEKAHQKLIVTKGKGFTKEKNKGKRGSYKGGKIDFTPKGIKFDD